MGKRFLIYSIVILSLSIFIAKAALAECRPNQLEVTIYNENSRRITVICVNEAAVGYIGGEGEIVIPATCPCFSWEDVENVLMPNLSALCTLYEGYTGSKGEEGEPCTDIMCYDNEYDYFEAIEGPGEPPNQTCNFSDPNAPISWQVQPPNWCSSDGSDVQITEEEGDACVAILRTFVQ